MSEQKGGSSILKKNKIQTRAFFNILLIVLIPVLIVLISIYAIFSQNLEKQVFQKEITVLNAKQESFEKKYDTFLKTANNVFNLYSSFDVYKSAASVGTFSYVEFKKGLDYILNSDETIASMYIYDDGAESIMLNGRYYKWDTFFDKKWLEDYPRVEKNSTYIIYGRSINNVFTEEDILYDTFVYLNYNKKSAKNTYIVININVAEMYRNILRGQQCPLYVLDNDNKVYYTNYAASLIKLDKTDLKGDTLKNEGREYYVLNSDYAINNRRITALYDSVQIRGMLKPIYRTIYLLCIIFVALIIILCFANVKRMFSGIDGVNEELNSIIPDISAVKTTNGLFRSLKEAILEMSAENAALSENIDKQNYVGASNKLYRIFHGDIPVDCLEAEYEIFGMKPYSMCTVTFDMSYASEDYNDEKTTHRFVKMINNLDIISNIRVVFMGNCIMCVVFYSDKSSNMRSDITYVCNAVLNLLPDTIVGISSFKNSLHQMAQSYSEAVTAMKYTLYNSGRILFYDDVHSENDCSDFDYRKYEREIIRSVRINDYDSAVSALYDMANEIEKKAPRPEAVITNFNILKARLIEQLEDKDNAEQINEQIESSESQFWHLSDYMSYFNQLIQIVSNRIVEKDTARKIGLLNDIKKYITTNVENNLTLISVADSFGISTSYLSALFRNESNESFVKYLIGEKMQHAIMLLETTNIPIKEIAGRLGYNERSFFATFKKFSGYTPNEYRNMHTPSMPK